MPSSRKILNASASGAIPSLVNQVLAMVRKIAEAKADVARLTGTLGAMVGSTLAISSLTQTLGAATATSVDHGRAVDEWVTIAGASPAGYNGLVKITVVLSPDTFRYAVPAGIASTATGTITATCWRQLEAELGIVGGQGSALYAYLAAMKTGMDAVTVADMDQN